MQINNFEDMYVAELQELFSMEGQLADALHEMAEVASHPFLKSALLHHGDGTQVQRQRLENLAEAWREPMGSHRPSHADATD